MTRIVSLQLLRNHQCLEGYYSNCYKYVPIFLFIKSPCPPFKGGTHKGLKYYQQTYWSQRAIPECKRSPLFKKGGQGGFNIAAHSYQSAYIYDISY